jgi:uncharacterized coiled-coil DUF342 family protein
MKRMSKAEEALNRQVKALDERLNNLAVSREAINNQILTTQDIRLQLIGEIATLRATREKASANATR